VAAAFARVGCLPTWPSRASETFTSNPAPSEAGADFGGWGVSAAFLLMVAAFPMPSLGWALTGRAGSSVWAAGSGGLNVGPGAAATGFGGTPGIPGIPGIGDPTPQSMVFAPPAGLLAGCAGGGSGCVGDDGACPVCVAPIALPASDLPQ
jgi:hypothetical protein